MLGDVAEGKTCALGGCDSFKVKYTTVVAGRAQTH